MKKRQHILPCGRVMIFKEFSPRDLARKAKIKNVLLSKAKELDVFSSYNTAGRKRSVWCGNTYNKFVSLLTEKLADHLLNSDRIETSPGRYWMIAGVGESSKHMNWHSDGVMYGIRITGMPGNYRVLLSHRRAMELKGKIMNGQKFHTIPI